MAYNAGTEAAKNWLADYSPLLLSYDRSAVTQALLAYCRLELADAFDGANENEIYTLLCVAFVQLHRRGAIQQLRPLSSQGSEQMAELLKSFNILAASDAPAPEEEDPYFAVVNDFKNLGSADFNAKLAHDGIYRKLYHEAVDLGRI